MLSLSGRVDSEDLKCMAMFGGNRGHQVHGVHGGITEQSHWVMPVCKANKLPETIHVFLKSKCCFNLLVHEQGQFSLELVIRTYEAEEK